MLAFFDQFPEYKGNKIEIRGNDGYFNATHMSKAMNKRFRNWTRTKFTKQLLDAISIQSRIPIEYDDQTTPIQFERGQKPLIDRGKEGVSDIYIHPYVAMSYAMSDPVFQAMVNIWIVNLMGLGTVNPHVLQWTKEEYQRGVDFNRDDIDEMYPKNKNAI